MRTPFGLLPLTAAERAAHKAEILAHGILTPSTFDAANTSLQYLFCECSNGRLGLRLLPTLTADSLLRTDTGGRLPGEAAAETATGAWEGFHAAIVQLAW